ncbi:NEW3 domain-containing protein [Catenulispora rubra]|uniref:NEW3 domain-containing protein n=1 Tax=Catenulispora rubra TaxID=280293 RepID=UPI00189254C3|nr:NEW3 domain-containing protein [Catenulispora rubra]
MSRTTPRRRLFGAVAATVMVFGALTAAAPTVSAATGATSTVPTTAPLPINTHPSYNGLALTPPMGFNDWAGFECNSAMNETLFTKTADQIVKLGLNKLGYDYVNIDDCWMQKTRDASGNLQVDATRFPHGLKWLGDYIHSKGLKFGIYEDAGYQTCQGAAGSYGHFQQDADLYASWGVDYLKLDYCYQPMDQFPGKTASQVAQIVYTEASQALLNEHRPMMFSESAPAYVCCSGADFTNELTWLYQHGNLWRFGSDIYDAWPSVLENYSEDNTPGLAQWAGPGHWNDADMLEVGNGGLSPTEEQTQMTLWAEMASPILLSTDLSKLTPAEVGIVANPDVVAVDQDRLGAQGTVVQSGTGYDVLAKPLANGDVSVVLFNKGDTAQTVTTDAATIGLRAGSAPFQLTDLVSKAKSASDGAISASLAPHATVIYRVHSRGDKHLPIHTAATISGAPLAAGVPTPVTVSFGDYGYFDAQQPSVTLKLPTGWTATPSSVRLRNVKPGTSATATFTVTASTPPPGKVTTTLSAAVAYRDRGTPSVDRADLSNVTNTPFPTLASAFNNIAISDETNPGPGNFDGDNDSYSAQALAAAGATPGASIKAGGTTFTWPSSATGTNDNVAGSGVLVNVTGQGSKLGFLGAEAGFATDTVTVTYTDGSSGSGSLGFPNWCCSSPTAYGATPTIVTTHRNTPSGPANFGIDYDVFYNSIAIDATKTVKTVSVPNDPAIHIFAMTVQP